MMAGIDFAYASGGMSGNDAGIKKTIGGIYVYGTGIERTKGKKTAVGTWTGMLLHPTDPGTGQPMRIDHGQRICRKLCRHPLRPLQKDHCGNGPLTGSGA